MSNPMPIFCQNGLEQQTHINSKQTTIQLTPKQTTIQLTLDMMNKMIIFFILHNQPFI
jgi:hypothetical protein